MIWPFTELKYLREQVEFMRAQRKELHDVANRLAAQRNKACREADLYRGIARAFYEIYHG